MDGDRGFFSAAGGTPNASGGPPGGLSMGATRARPVSAGTRLRQKPANAATHQDFFASLGIDGASRGRTGSSASTSSNRSYNSMTMRPASASGPGSTTSSSSGWRPPPIGGLGQRATPPPMPSVGSLSIAGVNRSMTTTTTTTSISSGLSVTGASAAPPVAVPPVAAPPVTTPPVAALSVKTTTTTTTTTEAKPTQLFSMEDAEDLYSDDGWNCDSPSTVLSNPPEEEATPTDPALEAAASEAPDDEFAWGDDDDAFASPVATTALSAQPPPFEMPSASAATSTFETEATTVSQPPPQVASSFSVGSSTGPFETTSYSVTQTTTQESRPPFEHTQTGSTLPPPTTASTSFLSTESTHSTFEAKSFTAKETPIQTAPSVEASVSNVPQDQGEQSGEDWDKHQGFVDNGSEITETTTKTYASTTVVTSILNETPIAPPVELASPGAAAGEFWGDGDEDALFDHDEHADEDWDETIKGQTPLGSIEKSHNPVSSFSAHEKSFSISSQPPLATSAVPTPIQEEDSLPVDQKDHQLTPELSETKPFGQKEVISESAASFPAIPPEVSDPSADSYFEAKPETHISPFSSAMAESSRQDHDLNAFPEVPRADRYLHTPTGTGGPFGRVPSPQGNSDSDFPDEFSGTVASIAHDTQQSAPNPVEFGDSMKGESQDSYADTNARYTGLLHSTENDQLPSEDQINPRDGEAQHSTRLGQSDEEERDSVVSFSGEHSFYPSTGRPSSLYGGSQSSFASHRMYQSSVASTDHEGSSIASFGVSSAGATFGGSERVSEGGAFSDGTVSETPSMVDSSNASTAFGTDFPSVSEGQFSAPGTTIGGSDNASDGGFSDGNASETTSMCESVNTNVRFVSEFNSSSGHYVTETIERRDGQALFASPPPDSNTAAEFGDSTLPAASSVIGGDESSADANPFASSPSAFPAAASTDSSFDQQPGATAPEENVESAASLFGATAGADVPNPFSSFGASPAPPALETKPIEEHELPTSDAGDLFGSGPASSGFESSFSQPAQHSYGSNYQTHDQNYNRAGQGSYSGTSNSVQSQFASSSPFDRSAATVSSSSPFESQSTSNYGNADPFASRGATQHGFGNSAPSADSVFSSHSSTDRNAAAHFAGSAQTGAGTGFDGNYSRSDMGTSIAADHFGQHGGDQSYGQSTTNYSDQGSVGASRPPNYYGGVQPQPQAAASTSSGQSFGQSSGVGAGVSTAGHFSRQSSTSSFTSNTAQRDTSGYGEQNRYGNQSSAPGTPDSYYQRSAASAFASGSPAQPSYGSKQDTQYGSRQYGQRSTPGTPDNYSHHSAAEVFGNTSSAQRSFGGRQDYGYSHGGQNARFGDHTRSSSSASADAFFGGASAASDFGGEHVGTPSSSSVQQAQGQTGQPSFSRSGSNTSSHVDQYGAHVQANTSAARPSSLSHDLNTSFSSVDNASISRHASSSSMNRYGSELSFQHEGIAPTRPQVDANSFFGGTPSEAVDASASSFFGNSQDSLDMQPSQSHETINPSVPEAQADEFVSPPQQETELQPQGESTHHDSSVSFGNATLVTKAIPTTSVDPTSGIVPAASSDLDQHKTNSFDETASTDAIAESAPTEQHSSPFGNEQDTDRPQAFDGFSASGSEQASSNFFSSSPALQTDTASSSYQSDQMGYHHQEQQQQQQQQQQQHNQAHNAAAASMQFAKAHSSFQHTSAVGTGASYGDSGVHTAAAHASSSYFDSGAPRAGSSGPANYSQHQMQQQRPQQQQYDQYQQEPHHQGTTGFSFHGATGQAQLRAAGYNASNEHQNGTAAGSGYGAMNTQQSSHPVAAPVMKTSNKYKDPCVAPPSCLASFGFGGNVVTMFPKRKLRLNITGSGYRNSPRGVPPPSEFENGGNGELRKGPVNLYHMDQLHPKDKEFEQMDTFPGPLTDDVSDEAILEYLDDRLKRSEAPTTVAEVEDENDRLLLGVLRVLVKCNGKLRSDPGTLNPSDPDSPEAQLISLLSENSKRRRGNQVPTFPAPRKVQSVTHPDLMVKHANQLRELLLVGDRKGAVSSAMAAHMWPEAMLIASFTDKEEYRRVLRTYLDETYATGDPCRALFMAFADQQEKSVQEPKRLLQTNAQLPAQSPVLTAWVSHAQVLLANRTADTSKILTELGDRLWSEDNAVAAAHICYLLAGIQVEAPMPTSKMALLGGDHRTPTEARFYVSPGAVQRTEIYEWAQKQSKGSSANLMIPFQGYKLIYAMLLADHGKLEIAFKYVTSMLTVIKAVTATMKPGTSMYLEGMKNQLTVLDDRLRQHLGQDRVASVAASTQRGSGRKQGKWGLGSALSMMGKIVNRVVEGNDASAAVPAGSATTPGGLYANEATPPAASYPGTPSVTAPTSSPTPSYPQQHAQQTPSPHAHMTPPASSHGPSPIPANIYNHATPPASQGSAPGSSNGYNRTPATAYSRPGPSGMQSSGPFSGNGRPGLQHQQSSGPFSGNGRPGSAGPFSNNGPGSQKQGAVHLMRSQHSMEPPGSNHSNRSFSGVPTTPTNSAQQHPPQYQQPPSSQSSQHSQHSQDTPTARPAFQKPTPLDLSDDTSSLSQPKTFAAGLVAEVATSLPPLDPTTMSGPSSDKGKASPKFKSVKKPGRSKTPPPSGSAKTSGWLSGLSSFIATKMNPEAKVAKLGEQMEAYFDEDQKRWVFPGEQAAEEPAMPSAPPTGPISGSAPGSSAGMPPMGTNSAPGSMSSGPAPSDDPLAALMAPPPSHMLMKKDPLAAMMAPPSRTGGYGARRGGSTAQRKPPRPQFAVFKPSAAPASAPDEPSE